MDGALHDYLNDNKDLIINLAAKNLPIRTDVLKRLKKNG